MQLLSASSPRAPRALFQKPPGQRWFLKRLLLLPPVRLESSLAPAWFRLAAVWRVRPRREWLLPEAPPPVDLTIQSPRVPGLVRVLPGPLPGPPAHLPLVPTWPVRFLPAHFAVRPQRGLRPPEAQPPEQELRGR